MPPPGRFLPAGLAARRPTPPRAPRPLRSADWSRANVPILPACRRSLPPAPAVSPEAGRSVARSGAVPTARRSRRDRHRSRPPIATRRGAEHTDSDQAWQLQFPRPPLDRSAHCRAVRPSQHGRSRASHEHDGSPPRSAAGRRSVLAAPPERHPGTVARWNRHPAAEPHRATLPERRVEALPAVSSRRVPRQPVRAMERRERLFGCLLGGEAGPFMPTVLGRQLGEFEVVGCLREPVACSACHPVSAAGSSA